MSVRGCLFTVLLLAACAPPVRAQSALTIDEAVQQAIDRNLTLLAERLNLTVADAAIATARLRPNPVLSGGANSLDWLGTGFNEVNGAGPQEYAVRVDVPFERGKKRELRTAVASTAKTVAEAQLADSIRRLRLDVTIAAVDVLEAKAKLKLAHENLDTLQRLVQLNERRLTSGALPPLEVTRSRVAMLQYRGSVTTAELTLTQARLKIHALVGRQPGDPLVDIEDDLRLTPATTTPTLDLVEAAARTNRPDVRALQGDEARSQYDLRLQIAQGRVDYTLGAEYRRQQGVNGKGNLAGVFVSVPLPIFNRNQGEIARAEAEHEKAARSLVALETNVSAEVASAYAEFQSTRGLLSDIERELLQPAAEARAGTAYVYQAGATSLLDVLDAQRTFNDTMDAYYTAQAAYRRAEARLRLVAEIDSRRRP
ncbi:MAG TPA: TolC family protein [Vicinamibacterales bacterium]|nr:TolC family protein [Vicinamibacterales bacterium]